MRKIKNKQIEISLNKAKSIIISPIVTEKSTMISQFNQYVFKVSNRTNAKEIKIAIEKLFKVKVKKVNTTNISGKYKTFKNILGRRKDYKKAIITLAKDNVLDTSAGIK